MTITMTSKVVIELIFTIAEFDSGTQLLEELYSVTGSAGAIIGTYDAETIGIMQNKEDHVILGKE